MDQTPPIENGSENKLPDTILIPEIRQILIELYSIIFSEGMWGMLSPTTQLYGETLYQEETGNKLGAPPGAMKYNIEQHIALMEKLLPLNYKATDFWKIVTQISWFVIAIEKNPILAMEIKESDNPEELLERVSEMCRVRR